MKIRAYRESDVRAILETYQRAFAGYPWFEDLSDEEILRRWTRDSSQPNFCCFVAEYDGLAVGTLYGNEMNISSLQYERGEKLENFVAMNYGEYKIFWEREVIVNPSHQGKGIAASLRRSLLDFLRQKLEKTIILTRMRSDNFAIMKVASKVGYEMIEITLPSSQKEGVFHRYWYCLVD
jgi:RimJ/RimL family protein N-acetyltransferase